MSDLEKDRLILELQKRVNRLEGKNEEGIATFKFSKITDKDLDKVVDIEKNFDIEIFKEWFSYNYSVSADDEVFFQKLIDTNSALISEYNEEDLKIKFITPILNKVEFLSYKNKFRDFYELSMTYKTEDFIFSGTTDFVVSKGLSKSEKPYFFIQEFKRTEEFTNPRPQLLAELISAIELNDERLMKGAYIIGEHWKFVILEKLGTHKYQYFLSQNFDSTKIEDLKAIYKNLLFVKNEIIDNVKEG